MIYDTALYGALTIFGVGLIYKVSGWFRFSVEMQSRDGATPAPSRIPTALKGVFTTLLSPKLSKLARVFVSDVLVQMRIRNEDFVRWLMHILIFAGFTFLFFTHALDKIILTSLYDRYYLDLNPFLIVAGLMVLAGVAIAAYRRFIRKVPRLKTAGPDYYAL
ncbi:MAG: hypothetical protein PVI54_08365, partial [Desulfobacteraceae bacterium]